MSRRLEKFERIARGLGKLSQAQPPAPQPPPTPAPPAAAPTLHPFDSRNIHPDLQTKVRKLFDDGHYPEATIHAFKHLENKIHQHSGITAQTGQALMMAAFDGTKIKLNGLVTLSETDEQEGYRFIFAGGTRGIRNPRGHDPNIVDDPDICLDHLSFVSMLLRRLEQAGYK